jgi:hypothetical protein
MQMKLQLKPGARLQSLVCDTRIMVVKACAIEVELCCGGQLMVAVGTEADTADIAAEFAQGTLMGKRYVDQADTFEFLCTKAGAGSLSIDGTLLGQKEARALPSSD